MSEEETPPKGPSLGGPKMPTTDKPATTSSQGQKPITGPKLEGDAPEKEMEKVKPKKKEKKPLTVHEIIRKWGVHRRRMMDSLQVMMIREIKTKVHMTQVNAVFQRNIEELMQGHLSYFEEIVDMIMEGDDPVTLELLEKGDDRGASTLVFDRLSHIIEKELAKLKEASPIITDFIDEDLNRFRDARVEPRASWWVLWYTALQLREVREKAGKNLDIVLSVMIKYPPVYKRVLGVMLLFADNLIRHFDPFPVDYSRMTLLSTPTGTGYNMAPWIKYRYGSYSQSGMTYENFIEYYARSFGTVPGNAPDFEGSPVHGYRSWIQRSLEGLENQLRESDLIMANARGNTLEGMLAGMMDELEEELEDQQFDEEGKLINQPVGGEGALNFIKWLFHTALQRYETTNISIHDEARMSLDFYDFVPDTVRWVNEYGEQLVIDWLAVEDEEEN